MIHVVRFVKISFRYRPLINRESFAVLVTHPLFPGAAMTTAGRFTARPEVAPTGSSNRGASADRPTAY